MIEPCNCGSRSCADGTRPHSIAIVGDRKFLTRSTGHSSQRYGACEVCGTHATEVFVQTEYERYETDGRDPPAVRANPWTITATRFGHAECLAERRRVAEASS